MHLPYISLKILARLLVAFSLFFFYLQHHFNSPQPSPSTIQAQLGLADDYTVPENARTLILSPGDNTFSFTPKPHPSPAFITLYYRCQPECPEMWFSIPGLRQTVSQVLIEHPIFALHPMPHLKEASLSLYQPTIHYSNINAFLATPPNSPIYADPELIPFISNHSNQVYSLKNQLPLKKAYILTTYQKPRFFGDWYELTRPLATLNPHPPIPATISAHFPPTTPIQVTVKIPQ